MGGSADVARLQLPSGQAHKTMKSDGICKPTPGMTHIPHYQLQPWIDKQACLKINIALNNK